MDKKVISWFMNRKKKMIVFVSIIVQKWIDKMIKIMLENELLCGRHLKLMTKWVYKKWCRSYSAVIRMATEVALKVITTKTWKQFMFKNRKEKMSEILEWIWFSLLNKSNRSFESTFRGVIWHVFFLKLQSII